MDRAYEQNELASASRRMAEIESSPLPERKEGCANFLEAMRDDPALIAERIGWLFDGNYGYGEMLKAVQSSEEPAHEPPGGFDPHDCGVRVAVPGSDGGGGVEEADEKPEGFARPECRRGDRSR